MGDLRAPSLESVIRPQNAESAYTYWRLMDGHRHARSAGDSTEGHFPGTYGQDVGRKPMFSTMSVPSGPVPPHKGTMTDLHLVLLTPHPLSLSQSILLADIRDPPTLILFSLQGACDYPGDHVEVQVF